MSTMATIVLTLKPKGSQKHELSIARNVTTNENLVVWRKELDKVGKKPRLGVI